MKYFLHVEDIIESSVNTNVLFKMYSGSWHCALFIGHLTLLLQTTLIIYTPFPPLTVLFNMHDTDSDGTITLEEYKHVRHINSIFVKHRTCVTVHAIH